MLKVMFMKVFGDLIKLMGKGLILVNLEISILVSGEMIKNMLMVKNYMQMGQNTVDNMKKE